MLGDLAEWHKLILLTCLTVISFFVVLQYEEKVCITQLSSEM